MERSVEAYLAQYCIIMPQNQILRLNQWFLKSCFSVHYPV